MKKLLSITWNKKKKHDKIFMWLKVNSVALKLLQALIEMEIIHEENLRNVSKKQEIMRLNSVSSRT